MAAPAIRRLRRICGEGRAGGCGREKDEGMERGGRERERETAKERERERTRERENERERERESLAYPVRISMSSDRVWGPPL